MAVIIPFPQRLRRPRPAVTWRAAAAVLAGAGVAWVVVRDGSPPWQVARLAAAAGLTAALSAAVDRGGPARRGGAAFAVGAVATAAGVGLGLPHLAKAGVTATTVAGLLVLGGGLVLLGAGAATLVGATPRWWRVAVVPALALAVLVAVWTLGQAVAATNVPRTEVGERTPADVGVAFEDVTFRTGDGVRLSGWYVAPANGAAVVLAHGAGSTRSSVLDHLVVLARHGYGVLAFDARGHGRSGGRAMDFGWHGDADVGAAVSFVAAQPGVDGGRIAAIGMSMGGEEAIGAAAGDDRIRAVVAEGATNRVAADKAWLTDRYGRRGTLMRAVEAVTYGLADLLTSARPPVALRDAVAAAAPRPVLLIAAGTKPDEHHAAAHLQGGSPSSVDVWVAEGAGHTDALASSPAEWERRVTGFLAAALAP